VVRNRFKRRVRAWFREHRQEIPEGIDLVVIGRAAGARLSYGQLDARLRELLGLVNEASPGSKQVTMP
jgi:ribonuclease P protein component